jgi:hypothetical protein
MRLGSGAMILAGFLFWLAISYFFYHRNVGGVVLLAAIAAGFSICWWIFSQLPRNDESRRSTPKPHSDLPDFNFKDVKPRDFE